MAKTDEKLQMIATSVILQAEQERGVILREAEQIREREIAAYRDKVIEEMYDTVQRRTRQLRQKAVEDKARTRQKAHRELLTRREELTASVFSSARLRLLEHTATPGYRHTLLERLAVAGEGMDHSTTTVFLRQEDMTLSQAVQDALPGCRVVASRQIRIGGFRLRNDSRGILVDETLDQLLEAQRIWFLEQCSLKVQMEY